LIVAKTAMVLPARLIWEDALCRYTLNTTAKSLNEFIYPSVETYTTEFLKKAKDLPNHLFYFIAYVRESSEFDPRRLLKKDNITEDELLSAVQQFLLFRAQNYRYNAKSEGNAALFSTGVMYDEDDSPTLYSDVLAEKATGHTNSTSKILLAYYLLYFHRLSCTHRFDVLSYAVTTYKRTPKLQEHVIYRYPHRGSDTFSNKNGDIRDIVNKCKDQSLPIADAVSRFYSICEDLGINVSGINPLDYDLDFYKNIKLEILHDVSEIVDSIGGEQAIVTDNSMLQQYFNSCVSNNRPAMLTDFNMQCMLRNIAKDVKPKISDFRRVRFQNGLACYRGTPILVNIEQSPRYYYVTVYGDLICTTPSGTQGRSISDLNKEDSIICTLLT